jgi:hypothetical protein
VMSFFTLPDLLFYFQVSVIVTEHSEILFKTKSSQRLLKSLRAYIILHSHGIAF